MDETHGSETATASRVSRRTGKPRRIAVLTSGGDAPGMNAAIRSVVRTAAAAGIEVMGVLRGFDGLIHGDFEPLPSRAVANIIQRGGTILETSRSQQFLTEAGRARAAENLRYRGAEGLVAIGGEGTLVGVVDLAREHDLGLMFIPASIDNDIPGTDYSIGFDTAVNTALEAIDRIRDTAFTAERLFFIEVMGRDSGFIALAVAIGGGAEAVVVPERPCDMNELCARIEESKLRGKRSSLIVVSEGPRTGGAIAISEAVRARLGVEARVVVLGHIQRGGSPTARDRLAASAMGEAAVRWLAEGCEPSMVAEKGGALARIALSDAGLNRRQLDAESLSLVSLLSM